MTTPKTIQVANTTDGRYDVMLPMPYPFHINADATVQRQEFWQGEPAQLMGFQESADVQRVDLLAEAWLATDDPAPVGWFPVFMDADGSIWSHKFPVLDRGL